MLRRLAVVVVLTLTVLTAITAAQADDRSGSARVKAETGSTGTAGWTMKRLRSPDRLQVIDASGVLATFTKGARTVTLRGPGRTFSEPTTTHATVRSTTWVRLLDQPFTGSVNEAWLKAALTDSSPDVLAVAMQYVTGAPALTDTQGQVVASDADYGPLLPDGSREEGSDFNDYLGITWTYPGMTDQSETRQYGSLDCSGFVRMVFGYRGGFPLTYEPDGTALPRRAVQMEATAPGLMTVWNRGTQATAVSSVAPGDLVFFDANDDDGTAIDHVGIFLGVDELGNYRFVSSRKTVNGPTIGDVGGRSTINGGGYYASAWRSARRL